jgi:hypothetical protein
LPCRPIHVVLHAQSELHASVAETYSFWHAPVITRKPFNLQSISISATSGFWHRAAAPGTGPIAAGVCHLGRRYLCRVEDGREH